MRIGAGAGYAGDRIEPAVELARLGSLDFLVFECLGERTIARENQSRLNGVSSGYNPFLEERMRAVLRICAQNGVRIVTNMGGADPWAAGQVVARIAAEVHGAGYRVAVVEGDDVMEQLGSLQDLPLLESGEPLDSIWDTVVSANAYLGAEVIADSLRGRGNHREGRRSVSLPRPDAGRSGMELRRLRPPGSGNNGRPPA
jgi:hypothetical protein